ncbi:CrcB-like protein [Caldithrix abyssi DSM 13497]|uniref:Fluoride-specific ion channel FluC n=1 Tax=Caldithrix abyssi DSM 13497 TaxID=880073 RepID=H1XRN1_CALAY|nr:fluoride efflux transporter CrcB [Caldithrix abyssi]APF20121.1 crcB camphor resistance protein CrcB [Caldithrix abyssi DSM 13497]EHO40184.1 CrcB-like protein [Caldithrix abyssi DSM 13497]
MTRLLLIGSGGFLGAVSRYLLSGLVYRLVRDPWFPYGTLAVNLIGCLIIGFLNGLIEMRHILSPDTRALLLIGFLGSFTTFSTFAFESFSLARDSQFMSTFLNLILHIVPGVLFVWLGYSLAKTL